MNPREQRGGNSARRLFLVIVAITFACAGCSYPVAEPENMELISSLRTALSAANVQWLDANEKLVEERRAAGEMRDDEYQAFTAIIRQAREGDWSGAERATLKFQTAQRPTPEQIEKLRAQRP